MAPQNSAFDSAFISPPPRVSVIEGPKKVVPLAYAAARTCYSDELVFPGEEASVEAMERLAKDTYQAGHHTLWQHANFVFGLDGISRLLVWCLLHIFPWYDSSQRSQRFVPVKPEGVVIPTFQGASLELYRGTVALMMTGYQKLVEMLSPLVEAQLRQRFPKGRKRFDELVTQKAQEVARYVLPLGTITGLDYTVNATTLMCLWRLCRRADLPAEGAMLVGRMVEEVVKRDPLFGKVLEGPLTEVESYEFTLRQRFLPAEPCLMRQKFAQEFDALLGLAPTKLVGGDPQAEVALANAVRGVLGLASNWLDREKAIPLVLDPAQNPYLSLPLNLAYYSPMMRILTQTHWTFRERLSNTCDSQWQRHRTAPSSRPLTWVIVREDPDYIVPILIRQDEKILRFYEELMVKIWSAIRQLLAWGEREELVAYLLPNAVTIRGSTSTDVASLWHKAKMRLCFSAQEEIWRLVLAQVREIDRVAPNIGKWLLAPCQIRRLAGITPYCPEGSRYCGVPVWEVTDHDYPPRII